MDDIDVSPVPGPGQLKVDIDVSTVTGTGLRLRNVTDSFFRELDLSWGGADTSGTGIELVYSSGNVIEDLTATNRLTGMYLAGGSGNNTIQRNDFSAAGRDGITASLNTGGHGNRYLLNNLSNAANANPIGYYALNIAYDTAFEIAGNDFSGSANGLQLAFMDDIDVSPVPGPGQLKVDIDVSTVTGTGLRLRNVTDSFFRELDLSWGGADTSGISLELIYGSGNTIENVIATNRNTGVYLSSSLDNTFLDSSILDNVTGVKVLGASSGIVINNSQIVGNSTAGVTNSVTPTVDATYNYWGAPDGPAPDGSGDAVVGNVDYIPFLGSPPPAEFVVSVVDQFGNEIAGSIVYVPGVGNVETGSVVSVEAGDLDLLVMPKVIDANPSSSLLSRTETRTVDVTTSELLFEWPVQQVTLNLVDQNDMPITGMNGQSSIIQLLGTTNFDNQSVVNLPITDDAVFPTISGVWADGYDMTLMPALLDSAPGYWTLSRTESSGTTEVSTGTTDLTFEWPVQQVTLNLVDQNDMPITGMNGQSSIIQLLGTTNFDNQSVVNLPITDDAEFLTTIRGYCADGYDITLMPALLDVNPNYSLLRRTEISETTEVSSDTTDLTFEWVTIEGSLQVVNESDVEIDGSEFTLAGGSTPTMTGTVVSLPITDNTVYTELLGNFADGYDFYIRPGDASTFSGPFAMELPTDGAFSPAFVDIDGAAVGLRFVTNQPPVADAGGPYTVGEGTPLTLDASASSDPDNDPLQYRWDFNGDGTWDTAYSSDPTAEYTWPDDYSGLVIVEVSDGQATDTETTTVTVNNVAPTLGDASFTIEENTPNGTLVGSVTGTDPGTDTLTYSITGGSGETAFAIDSATGAITVADQTQLDFETSPSLTVEVQVAEDDGGTGSATVTVNLLNQASITGEVFVDVNQNGLYDANEPGIDGVVIELLDEFGAAVLDDLGNPITATTTGGGFYLFEDLDIGTYQLHEIQPSGVDDGAELLGSLGGTIPANDTMQLAIERTDATDYVFAELGQQVTSGDTATIGFWHNKHGQALITQGGTALAQWLSANFDNVFGDEFVGAGGSDVAQFFNDQLFKQKGKKSNGPAKVDAQFMAVALATYFTSSNLAGNVAGDYGFNVTDTGIGTRVVNVGSGGAAFSVANDTDVTIMQLLQATNALTDLPDGISGFAHIYDQDGDGQIDEFEALLRVMANDVYSTINEQGDI